MSHAVDDALQAGREAIRRHAWREAFEFLTTADASSRLNPEDLDHLGEASWWTGRLDSSIAARERAYATYLEAGNVPRTAMMALELSLGYAFKGAASISAGWLSRAERLLQDQPESVEHGYMQRRKAVHALGRGDHAAALVHAKKAVEIGMRFSDRDLQAIGLHDQGRGLIAMGKVDDGLSLIDEATVAAVGGELQPHATAIIYCNTIGACRDMADFRRAGDWTDAAKRWCDRQNITGFPGMCRVYRAEIMMLRGAWNDAELEARRACEELRDFCLGYAAEAFYEVGEIRLRMGDFASAEEAFRQANELGRVPQPGLALLRLAEGKADAALTSIRSALAEESDRLVRARRLPAMAEIAAAAGDQETIRAAAEELETIAEIYATPALRAWAAWCRGTLELARGDMAAARRAIRRSVALWQEVEAPYESARSRMLLAATYQGEGDEENARMELEAARSAFDRLGALPDARRAAALLPAAPPVPLQEAANAGLTRAFMFTDIERSTPLIEAIGDEAWDNLRAWHDQTLRSLFAGHGGEEIDHAGEGFFVAFETAPNATECAVAVQRALAEHRRSHGFAPQVRIGLHTADARRRGREYVGKGVHAAARIAALAEGGQILASQETVQSSRFTISPARTVTLKGLSVPVQVVAIEWR